MQKWEYTTLKASPSLDRETGEPNTRGYYDWLTDDELNKMGEEGWELVSVEHTDEANTGEYASALFKRKKPTPRARKSAPTEPQEHRIPIPDRPKPGESWFHPMFGEVIITGADPWGRSFDYERIDELGRVKKGTIGQSDVLDGKAYRLTLSHKD